MRGLLFGLGLILLVLGLVLVLLVRRGWSARFGLNQTRDQYTCFGCGATVDSFGACPYLPIFTRDRDNQVIERRPFVQDGRRTVRRL